MTTTLTLFDAHGVLETLFKSSDDVAKCAVCHTKLTGDSFYVCRYPDVAHDGREKIQERGRASTLDVASKPQSTSKHRRGSGEGEGGNGGKGEHKGHTACKVCVDEWKYIGDAGSCAACLRALGNRRSAIKFAGVALRPAIENDVLNKVLANIRVAEQSIDVARERGHDARIQEGADRRAAAVEAKRLKRELLLREAEDDARRAAMEITSAAEREVRGMRKRAERDIREQQTRAAELATEIVEHARNEAASSLLVAPLAPTKKKRTPLAPESLAKRRATLAAKVHMQHDAIASDRDRATRTLDQVVSVSKLWIERLGGDVDVFARYLDQCIANVE